MTSLQISSALPKSLQVSPPVLWPPSSRLLPTSAGVYLFLGETKHSPEVTLSEVEWGSSGVGDLLYIGKAKNLRHRLASYKLAANLIGKTKTLIDNTRTVQWIITGSDLEAIILEAHLIKTFTPKFNLRLRDDKSPLYIVITDEPFPRVLTSRKPSAISYKLKAKSFFGPFSSSSELRRLLKFLRRAFPFCNATPLQKRRGQACFYYHLDLCSGACKGLVDKRTYRTMIRHLIRFLSADFQKVTNALTKRMHSQAKKLNFESAALMRNQLNTLQNLSRTSLASDFADEVIQKTRSQKALQEIQQVLKLKKIPRRIECYDVSNLAGKFATAAMVVATNGTIDPSEYRHFKIKTLSVPHDPGMIAETISRRLKNTWPSPNLILVDGGITQVNAAQNSIQHSALSLKHNWHLVPIMGLAKKDERIVLNDKELHLPRYSPALQLLQRLRDESHRFSRKLHHHLHKKATLV